MQGVEKTTQHNKETTKPFIMIAKVAICGILLCCYIVNVHCFLGPIRSLKSRELKQSAAVISKVLNSHDGLVKDMISAACLSTVGDLIAQAVDQKGSNVTISFDLARMRQFTLFGFFDGAMAHTWYHTLDGIITGSSLKDLILRISTDTLV